MKFMLMFALSDLWTTWTPHAYEYIGPDYRQYVYISSKTSSLKIHSGTHATQLVWIENIYQ